MSAFRSAILSFVLILTILGPQSAVSQQNEFRVRAEAFRLVAAGDFYDALELYSTPKANLVFASLAENAFPVHGMESGWKLYLSLALTTLANQDQSIKTAVYLHPWSDTMLLTFWDRDAKGDFRIIQAMVAPSSIFRGEDAPYPTMPAWQTEDFYAPEGVGLYNAFSSDGVSIAMDSGMQDMAINLGDTDKSAFALGVGMVFLETQADLLPILKATDGPAAEVRVLYKSIFAAWSGTDNAVSKEFASQFEVIAALPPRVRATFLPVAYASFGDRSLLILASVENPDVYIASRHRHAAGAAKLEDFALYSFQSFYDYFQNPGLGN